MDVGPKKDQLIYWPFPNIMGNTIVDVKIWLQAINSYDTDYVI